MAPMSSAAGYVEQLPLPGKAFRNGRAPRAAECAPVRELGRAPAKGDAKGAV